MSYINKPEYDLLLESFAKGDWETVLATQSSLNDPYFLWPKPKRNDLYFIADALRELNIKILTSIGCGCGLLEWLLTASSGFKVIGVEVDQNYWKSKYARKKFIELVFPQDKVFSDLINKKNNALMFCYFNDKNAFQHYISIYKGKCIIIIGPVNCGKHTDPSPFDEEIPKEWELWKQREISFTKDYIAVYIKK